jgi:hypothetical protein
VLQKIIPNLNNSVKAMSMQQSSSAWWAKVEAKKAHAAMDLLGSRSRKPPQKLQDLPDYATTQIKASKSNKVDASSYNDTRSSN